ncbi:DNA primase small subunit domain-containing protein [Nanoarchaeota archaeon]
MDPVTLSRVLNHYKRREVQSEIVAAAAHKEAVGSFGGKGYAKRPDVLVFPNDVLEQVKNGVTSFHVSEELWSNPQMISVNMKKHEYDDMRIGWDLVLDIDCPFWEFAKLTTWLFVRALREFGVDAVTVKFSGNKGFHIGVPFEAFPETFKDVSTKDYFPDGPRKIAAFLLDHISTKYVKVVGDKVQFTEQFSYTLQELESKTGKATHELVKRFCSNCGKKTKDDMDEKKVQFVCAQCEGVVDGDMSEDYKSCPKCKVLMERSVVDLSKKCCSRPAPVATFDPLSIVEVDTVLIAPRHLYRAPYSYHEKSGLVSVPIHPDSILDFEKSSAEPDDVEFGKHTFLLREGVVRGHAAKLLLQAEEFAGRKERRLRDIEDMEQLERKDSRREFEDVQTAIPESFFPPCIQLISKGVKDGRKRAVFLLINFLSSCGWEYDDIEEWLKKWNSRNAEPLRDQYYLGQLRYAKQHKKKVLPPNCDNNAYYKSFGVCKPDMFCKYVKNPANYAIKRARYASKQDMKGKKKAEGAEKAEKPANSEDVTVQDS